MTKRSRARRNYGELPTRKYEDEEITSNTNEGELRTRQTRKDEGYEREPNASNRTTEEDNHAYVNTIVAEIAVSVMRSLHHHLFSCTAPLRRSHGHRDSQHSFRTLGNY